MEIKEIELSAVVPNERNPRSDFGDLDALWESFAFNTANPGEPVNPIVVVADGNAYRIVDGERRYRAMVDHGRETCHALVCEGYDDMEQAVQMLATDDKLSLTAQEQCQGIQDMLLLGVDVQRIAGVSHASEDDIRKVGKVIRCRGYGNEFETYQATLDQMLAVADVDENGDGDLADELLSDRNWRQRYDKFCREREREHDRARLVEAARDAGFTLLDEDFDPEDYGPVSYTSWPEAFEELYEKGYRFAVISANQWSASCRVYMPAGMEPGQSEEEAAAERERAEREAARVEAAESLHRLRADVGKWYMAAISSGSPTHSQNAMENQARKALFSEDAPCDLPGLIKEYSELTGWEKGTVAPPQLTPELKAAAFPLMYPKEIGGYTLSRALGSGIDGIDDWSKGYAVESAAELCATVNQFVAAGYKPSEWADELMRKVEMVASWEDEGADGEDE